MILYFLFRMVSVGEVSPTAWYDYTQFIDARERLVANLGFWDFTLVYTVIPLLVGFLIAEVVVSRRSRRGIAIRVALLVISLVVVNLALFQKRSAIAALLLAGAYVYLRADCWEKLGMGRRARALIAVCALTALVLASLYFVALIVPLVRPSSTAVVAPPPSAPADRGLGYSYDFEKGAVGWTTTSSALERSGARTFVTRGQRGDGLEVLATAPGQGVIVPLAQPAPGGSEWRIRTWLRSERPETVNLVIGGRDTERQKVPVHTIDKWQLYNFAWSPDREVPSVAFGLETTGPGRIELDQVQLRIASLLPTRTPKLAEGFGLPVTPKPAIERAKRLDERRRARLQRLRQERQRRARERQAPQGGGALGPGSIGGAPAWGGAISFPDVYQVKRRSREEYIALTALFGPLMRTAGPVVAYPAIYPSRHPYYPVDFGLDIAGVGNTEDDNVSSWNAMFPENPGGNNSVPFQFTLYSQGGLLVALVGSLLLGILWRSLWEVGYLMRERTLAGPAVGALTIVFGLTIAADSWRNAMLASYGIFWPIALIVVGAAVYGLIDRLARGLDAETLPNRTARAPVRQ